MATAYLPDRLAPLGYKFIAKLLPVPERLVLIDIDPAIANERISKRAEKKEMFEDPANLKKAREKLLSLASTDWKVIDNSVPMEKGKDSCYKITGRLGPDLRLTDRPQQGLSGGIWISTKCSSCRRGHSSDSHGSM